MSQNLKCILRLREFLCRWDLEWTLVLEFMARTMFNLAEFWQNGISGERKWNLLLIRTSNYHLGLTEELSPNSLKIEENHLRKLHTLSLWRDLCVVIMWVNAWLLGMLPFRQRAQWKIEDVLEWRVSLFCNFRTWFLAKLWDRFNFWSVNPWKLNLTIFFLFLSLY